MQRLEQQSPGAVMAHLALDAALPAQWIDEVFQAHRSRQYPRQLLFSSVVELMLLVTLGLRPSLHAAARRMRERLPVSLAALYAKVRRTEPEVLRALVQGSAQRLQPLAAGVANPPSLPGWQLRVLDGNHLPASDKRLGRLRGYRGAALPGHSVVVYDPDTALVCDMVACEDAYESERTGAALLIAQAGAGQAWIADRHFCTQALLQGLHAQGAGSSSCANTCATPCCPSKGLGANFPPSRVGECASNRSRSSNRGATAQDCTGGASKSN